MDVRKLLNEKVIVLDGAMGTMIPKDLLKSVKAVEVLNLTHPEIIEDIHRRYIKAGAQIIYTNTFGANIKKLPKDYDDEEIITAAIKIAKKASQNTGCLIALDIGSIGELMEPLGKLTFDQAYDIFSRQIKCGVKNNVDLIVLETISDLYEMKTAVLAAKENSDLPIIATMTFEQDTLRTFMGCDIKSMAYTLEGLGVDAVGINCSFPADKLLPLVEELLDHTMLPVVIKVNAGLPDVNQGFTHDIDSFISSYKKFIKLGVSIVGGCCGTTPDYIKELSQFNGMKRTERKIELPSAVCTPSKFVDIKKVRIIGERLNPTGKKAMKEALLNNDSDYIVNQAIEQINAGADILDINCGLPQIDEKKTMTQIVKLLQSVTDTPLQIDSTNREVIEDALRYYNGKAIVNSVNGDDEVLDSILPIVKKYGAAVIGLTLDKDGIPKTKEQRIRIAEKIIKRAKDHHIPSRDIFIDPLTLTVSAEQDQAKITLETIRYINDVMGYNTVLGISNISFGLPNRDLINSSFLLCALNEGLTLPIINPNNQRNMDAIRAFNVLYAHDTNCSEFISAYKEKDVLNENKVPKITSDSLEYSILNGLKKECRKIVKNLLKQMSPLDVVNKHLIPALDKVGALYEQGVLFLPQLIMSAETAKVGFEEIKSNLKGKNASQKGHDILLATVKGDIHDIGKNIVKVVLENYGYNIIDLGKDVDPKIIVDTIREKNIKLAGLSALMTTTAVNMQKTVEAIRKHNLDCKVMVGGAVISPEFAKSIKADFYAKDANQAVKIAKQVFQKK